MRHRVRPAVAALIVAVGVAVPATVVGAQTTTTTVAPATTTVPPTTPASTVAPVTTTVVGGATATTVAPTATSAPLAADTNDDDGSSIPWIPIAIAVVVLAIIVAIIAVVARKRGAARQLVADWRHDAADATAEAGATARLLSQGTPPSGQIAQQILTSLRAFEDLSRSAPDDNLAAVAERARRALQILGLALDSDYRLRRAQPPVDPQQLARSQESVQNAAGETDRTLRGVYRTFTSTD